MGMKRRGQQGSSVHQRDDPDRRPSCAADHLMAISPQKPHQFEAI